jgi:hypothetical protein
MEPNQPQNQPPLFQLNIDMNANMALRGAASWAKVLAIVGFIIGILFVIMGVLVQNAMSSGAYYGRNSSMVGNVGMAVYIVMGLIMVIGSIFALNFSNKISSALRANDQVALAGGIGAARNYFAFWAILCIIFLLLILISVVSLLGK